MYKKVKGLSLARGMFFCLTFIALLAGGVSTAQAYGGNDVIGSVEMFAGSFAPQHWMLCDGSLLAIADNTALFSLLGITYGGDGRTTFGLPDLRGRVPVGMGTGPGLSTRNWGAAGGQEKITTGTAGGGLEVYNEKDEAVTLNNMPPFLTVNYIICVEGLYPSRP